MSGALPAYLYKVCDSILNDLLIAKFAAYVFGYNLCKATFQKRKQRIKVNVACSMYCEISVEVT